MILHELANARRRLAARPGYTALSIGVLGLGLGAMLFLLALALAAAGLYGVLAFAVEQRTREIGIRRAIGAGSRGIVASVSRRALWQVGLGLTIGLALALPWSAMLASEEMQTRGQDPAVMIGAIVLLLAVAMIASLAPLRRALRVDPMIALRQD